MEPLKTEAAWAGVSAAVFLGEHQATVDFSDAETFEVLGGRNVFDELTYGAPLRRKGLSEEQIRILKTGYEPELGFAAWWLLYDRDMRRWHGRWGRGFAMGQWWRMSRTTTTAWPSE